MGEVVSLKLQSSCGSIGGSIGAAAAVGTTEGDGSKASQRPQALCITSSDVNGLCA